MLSTRLDSKNIYVQAAAFKDEVKARQMVDSLGRFGQAHIQSALVNGQEWYRVRFGPMRDSQSADMLSTKLGDSGRANAIVIID